MITIDLQGTYNQPMRTRNGQVINAQFVIADNPFDLDTCGIEFIVNRVNYQGVALLTLNKDNGGVVVTDTDSFTVSIDAPTYDGYTGGAYYTLTIIDGDAVRTICEGEMTIL